MKIIKFNAVWCPACLVSNQYWKKIINEFNNIEIINYDYDIDEEEVLKYEIGDILPVVIKLDDNNKEVDRLIGEASYDEIVSFLRK